MSDPKLHETKLLRCQTNLKKLKLLRCQTPTKMIINQYFDVLLEAQSELAFGGNFNYSAHRYSLL